MTTDRKYAPKPRCIVCGYSAGDRRHYNNKSALKGDHHRYVANLTDAMNMALNPDAAIPRNDEQA